MEEPEPLSPVVFTSAFEAEKMRGWALDSALPLKQNHLKI